jgi:hypothetical protein
MISTTCDVPNTEISHITILDNVDVLWWESHRRTIRPVAADTSNMTTQRSQHDTCVDHLLRQLSGASAYGLI